MMKLAMNDLNFLQGIYDSGGGDYFDVLAAHPYGFGRPPTDPPAFDRLNFRRIELLREIMVANGDAAKPVWVTEMGWRTSAPNPADTWQVVTPRQQRDYVFEAIDYATKNYPWLEKMALWELNAGGDDYGYYLWHGLRRGKFGVSRFSCDLCAGKRRRACSTPATTAPSTAASITILAPDVAIRLGDRGTLHPHWVHLHRGGENFSPAWQGDFFLSAAQANRHYDLLLETMQVDQPTNRLQINGVELPPLQTRSRPDPTSTWATQRFEVDKTLLQAGQNSIQLLAGLRNPAHQYSFWRWENFQFRNIRLIPPQPPEPLPTTWEPLPSPGGWSETNRLRPGLQNDFWLTGNRLGQLWRGTKATPQAVATVENQAANRPDLVFVDVLPTPQGLLAATHLGLFRQADGQADWTSVSGTPEAYGYVLAQHNGQLYAGFEAEGLWSASTPTGPWQPTALSELTVLDIAAGSQGQLYVATDAGVYVKFEPNEAWQLLPALPGDSDASEGNALKRFITRIYAGQNDDIVVRNLDQLWRYPAGDLRPNPPAAWQPFGPPTLHRDNKIYSVLNCCESGAIVGTNFSGLWQLSAEDTWERLDAGAFDVTNATGLLQLEGDLYAAGIVTLLQSTAGDQQWAKVEGLPATVSDLLIDPTAPERWLAATPAGVYRSRDSGQSWQAVSPPWTVWDMAFGPTGRLFVARNQGVAWADDLGREVIDWQETDGLEDVLLFNVDPHPTDPAVLLAGTWGNDLGMTNDGGQTMRSIRNGLETLSVLDVLWHPAEGQLTIGTIEGLYRTDNFGEDWFKLPGALKNQTIYSLHQTADSAIWAGAANGLWVSRDYGVTWQQVNDLPAATVLRLGQIMFQGQMWLWAGTETEGVWLSDDQGESWQFGGLSGYSIYNLLPHPQQPERLLAATEQGILGSTSLAR